LKNNRIPLISYICILLYCIVLENTMEDIDNIKMFYNNVLQQFVLSRLYNLFLFYWH